MYLYNTSFRQIITAFDKIRQKISHLLPYLLSHYSFFLFYSHRISLKDTSSIHFLFHIVQTTIISISSNSLALFLKLFQIIDDFASEKCCSIFQCRLVNNYNIPLHSHPICAFAHIERILPFQSRKCLQIFFVYFCFDIFYFIRIYERHAASFKSCS